MTILLLIVLFSSSCAVERVSLRSAGLALASFGTAGLLVELFPSAGVWWVLLALAAGSVTVLAGRH